jgi:chemotaxis protein CheD
MAALIEVPVAGFAIAKDPDSLITVGIGSCIAICLHSQDKKVGALLHVMLPKASQDLSNPFRYVDTALSQIFEQLQAIGINSKELAAKLVGGAQMFPSAVDSLAIGQTNIQEATRLLSVAGVSVIASEVGGHNARSIVFEAATGIVSIFQGAPTSSQKI